MIEEIAVSFINGNLSWVKNKLKGKKRLSFAVALWLREFAPDELNRFLRMMAHE